MILNVLIVNLVWSIVISVYSVVYAQQDQTSTRANTLQDDADDIQRQLDNEARDRIKYGGHKTIWILHFPTGYPDHIGLETATKLGTELLFLEHVKGDVKRQNLENVCHFLARKYLLLSGDTECPSKPYEDWSYKDQKNWHKTYPACGGRSQSPVDLPYKGLIEAKGARKLAFKNYGVKPTSLIMKNDGRTISLSGKWKPDIQPFIYGGAAHGRRYIFHSMTFHWPSEHFVGGLQYPMESQVLHISTEYKNMEEAINASAKDPLAFLIVANLYKFGDHTQEGLHDLLHAAKAAKDKCQRLPMKPLEYYNPPLKEYACYQGSLTVPPCKEAVLWLVRAKAMRVSRGDLAMAESLFEQNTMRFRLVHPMNDRKTYFFKN